MATTPDPESSSGDLDPATPGGGPAGPRRTLSLGCLSGLLIGGALLAVTAGLLIVALTWRAGQRRVVDEELARLRAAGLPTSSAELDAYYAVDPDRPDATAAWLGAIAAQRQPAVQQAYHDLLYVNQTWVELEAQPTDRLAAFVADHADVYAAIDRAAAAGSNVRYTTNFSLGFYTQLEDEQQVRGIARLIDVRVLLALREDRVDDAIDGIGRLVVTGDTLAGEPLLISQLIRLAIHAVGLARAEDLLAGEAVTASQLDRLAAVVTAISDREGLTRAIAGERTFILDVAEGPSAPVEMGEPNATRALSFYRSTPLVVGDERLALEIFGSLEAASRQDGPTLLAALDDAEARLKARLEQSYIPPVLVSNLMPAIQSTGSAFVRGEATRELLLAGIAARRSALRAGHLPRSAEELAAELPGGLPPDPFDGRPLRVKAVADSAAIPRVHAGMKRLGPGPGLAIYSVGRNRVDDGGVDDPPAGLTGDLLLFVPETPDAGRLGPFETESSGTPAEPAPSEPAGPTAESTAPRTESNTK